MNPIFFNAHHSPAGAFATWTLGMEGKKGGFGIELAGPACQNVVIGIETQSNVFTCLPFFEGSSVKEDLADYGLSDAGGGTPTDHVAFYHAESSTIDRSFGPTVDRWTMGDSLELAIYSPLPDWGTQNSDPEAGNLPAIFAVFRVSNHSSESRRYLMGFEQNHPQFGMRPTADFAGVQNGVQIALATNDSASVSGVGFSPGHVLSPRREINRHQMLGNFGAIYGTLDPGETREIPVAIAFHKSGATTSGVAMEYAYCKRYPTLESVLHSAFAVLGEKVEECRKFDLSTANFGLSKDRHFMLSHAIRSYYGCTQHLREIGSGTQRYVVHEGEYRMMNTLDLTADMCFWELDFHPWTVRNVLDWFAESYSYHDEIVRKGVTVPGGVSFTHDMGVSNQFSRSGYSSYERAGYDDCFSYMTAEELLNWIGVACTYGLRCDHDWLKTNHGLLKDCLESVLRRDDPDPKYRQGFIRWDSSRCEGGAEITTYDSLDISLGQTRGSGYMSGKMYGICLLLEEVFRICEDEASAELTKVQAGLCSKTLQTKAENGVIPSVFEGEVGESTIIPHIEGLIWPLMSGMQDRIDQDLLSTLKTHLESVLKPGVCKFPDGGWKLSSTSDNSWLSKIYLCQYVAETLLDSPADTEADAAHVEWLTRDASRFFAWSDQMILGNAIGSKYYPRGVTAWLWTQAGRAK